MLVINHVYINIIQWKVLLDRTSAPPPPRAASAHSMVNLFLNEMVVDLATVVHTLVVLSERRKKQGKEKIASGLSMYVDKFQYKYKITSVMYNVLYLIYNILLRDPRPEP